jgi:hypothetical protein
VARLRRGRTARGPRYTPACARTLLGRGAWWD